MEKVNPPSPLLPPYAEEAPSRAEVDALPGVTVIEFGTGWCGVCHSARPLIAEAFARRAGVRHMRIEDGPGRALGRSFRVKLWPTLIFLHDGVERARLVRPTTLEQFAEAFALAEAQS